MKMDENNQYGMAMTRPLPYSKIKRKDETLNLEQLKELLKNVTLEDKIGHLFTVDIKFADINEKTLLFNEIYPPIFEKHKIIPPHQRSTCKLSTEQKEKKKKTKFQNCHIILKLILL